MKQFRTEKERAQPIVFAIDADEFEWTPPKQAGLLLDTIGLGVDRERLDDARMDQVRAQIDWVSSGLHPDDRDLLLDRLRDPDDSFDVDQLVEVMKWLIEQTTARPTRRPSASSRRSSTGGGSGQDELSLEGGGSET